jgi:hypothetical protein
MTQIETIDIVGNRLQSMVNHITQCVLDTGSRGWQRQNVMIFRYTDKGEIKDISVTIYDDSLPPTRTPVKVHTINIPQRAVSDRNRAVIRGIISSHLTRRTKQSDPALPNQETLAKAYSAYALDSTDYAVYRIQTMLENSDNPRVNTLRENISGNTSGVITALISLIRDANDEQDTLIDQYGSIVMDQTKYMGIE